MKKDLLIKIIENAGYFSEEKKQKFVKLIPTMTDDQLDELSGIVEWAELQKANLDKEKNIMLTGFYKVFSSLNKEGSRRAKKGAFSRVESKIRGKEVSEAEKLLNQLDND